MAARRKYGGLKGRGIGSLQVFAYAIERRWPVDPIELRKAIMVTERTREAIPTPILDHRTLLATRLPQSEHPFRKNKKGAPIKYLTPQDILLRHSALLHYQVIARRRKRKPGVPNDAFGENLDEVQARLEKDFGIEVGFDTLRNWITADNALHHSRQADFNTEFARNFGEEFLGPPKRRKRKQP